MRRSQEKLGESALSFCHVGFRDSILLRREARLHLRAALLSSSVRESVRVITKAAVLQGTC